MSKQQKTMKDGMGNAIPVKYVKPYDRATDKIVWRMVNRARKTRQALENYVLEQIDDILTLRAERSKAGMPDTGAKGNCSFSSFDRLARVSCVIRTEISCDDRLLVARDRMFAYIKGKIKDYRDDTLEAVLPIIEDAFKTTRTGGLSVARVMALLRLEIKAPEWQKAKQLLADSISAQRGKEYLKVETREDYNSDYRQILLDACDCLHQHLTTTEYSSKNERMTK